MTLDEAIKHCEEEAIDKANFASILQDSIKKARYENEAEEYSQFAEWLKELKQLKEQSRWIPVSERLPEESGNYLVVFRYGWRHCREICYFDGFIWNRCGYDEIVKWQYLPDE